MNNNKNNDKNTPQTVINQRDGQSVGDQPTTPEHIHHEDSSLGSDITFRGATSDIDGASDDKTEIVDLSYRYKELNMLGQGGMGEVFLALDTRLNRKVAIKRILANDAQNQSAVTRFLTEAQSIAALNHPNIVQIYDYGRTAEGPFLIMEYADGGSLLDLCRVKPLPARDAVELIRQLCDGLTKAHAAGIIHRDIKPANILLTQDQIPKLTDFGLAKTDANDKYKTITGAILGTPDFMPPEQRKDAALTDTRSDVWSLAATLYQLITGRSPRIINLTDIPDFLQSILIKALAENQEERYQTAREFKDALTTSLQDSIAFTLPGEGDCPHCGVHNETSRKFCRGCAGSLEVHCLSCSENMPAWEDVCGNCGGRQSELLEYRRAEMNSQQSEAESRLKVYDFERAIELATILQNETDLRLQNVKEWAENFLLQVAKKREEKTAEISTLIQEATEQEEAHDYRSGIHTLEQIPEALRTITIPSESQTAQQNLDRIKQKYLKCKELEKIIRIRVQNRQLDGLQKEIDEYIELKPDRSDLRKLKEQLKIRDEKQAARISSLTEKVQELHNRCRFEASVKLLKKIPEDQRPDKLNELLELSTLLAENRKSALKALKKTSHTQNYSVAISNAEQYKALLEEHEIFDKDFDHDYQNCLDAELILRQANLEKQRQQRRVIKLYLGAVIALALVCLTGGTLWFRSASQAQVLEEAVKKKEWDTVLKIDSQNVDALMGRASQRLNDSEPDIDGAFADLAVLARVAPSVDGLNSIKALAYAKRAMSLADLGKVPEAKQDYDESQALGASEELLRLTKQEINDAEAIKQSQSLIDHDFDAALKIYDQLSTSGVETTALRQLKSQLKKTLVSRFQKAIDSQNIEQASVDILLLNKLIPKELKTLIPDLNKFPPKVLMQLPPSLLSQFSPSDWPVSENSIGMKFKLLPGGKFTMGSTSGEKDEQPLHQVKLTNNFQIGIHEVTQGQYQKVMGINPSHTIGLNFAVEKVDWQDASDFCKKLSELPEEKNSGYYYRLPTEAEWEYACRAGSSDEYSFGDTPSQLGGYAWYIANSNNSLHPVGQKAPNLWGLYDMHGNVWEWCQDWYSDYPNSIITDPTGPASGITQIRRVRRGGSWIDSTKYCRSAYRNWYTPKTRSFCLGFRVSRHLVSTSSLPTTSQSQPQSNTPTHLSNSDSQDSKSIGHFIRVVKPGWQGYNEVSTTKGGGTISIAEDLPPRFEAKFTITRLHGREGLGIGIARSDLTVLAILDHYEGSGLELIDGKRRGDNSTFIKKDLFTEGKPTEVTFRVDGTSVIITVDHQPLIHWSGNYSRLSPSYQQKEWGTPNGKLCISSGEKSSHRIQDIKIRALD